MTDIWLGRAFQTYKHTEHIIQVHQNAGTNENESKGRHLTFEAARNQNKCQVNRNKKHKHKFKKTRGSWCGSVGRSVGRSG